MAPRFGDVRVCPACAGAGRRMSTSQRKERRLELEHLSHECGRCAGAGLLTTDTPLGRPLR
jgi:DnaJ-class molecular chaperone